MYKKESYSFKEYKVILENRDKDLNAVDKFIGNLKKNKKEYTKLVFLIAVFIHKNNIIYAGTIEGELSSTAMQLIDMLIVFARYGCIFMGGKTMLEHMLHGANLKQATTEGLQYFLFYLILQFYPKLFSIVKF